MEQRFPRVKGLVKGYDRRQVETFLTRVEQGLNGSGDLVGAEEVRRVGFDLVRGGYDVATVDNALDGLEEQAMAAEAAVAAEGAPRRRGGEDPAQDLRRLVGAERGHRMPRCGRLQRGYDPAAVDAFLEQLPDALEGRSPLDAQDVRSVRFRPRRGGYSEGHVDDLLDRVVDVLLRRSVHRDGPEGRDGDAGEDVQRHAR